MTLALRASRSGQTYGSVDNDWGEELEGNAFERVGGVSITFTNIEYNQLRPTIIYLIG